jgi:outer membrane lipoprotein-sorting protein
MQSRSTIFSLVAILAAGLIPVASVAAITGREVIEEANNQDMGRTNHALVEMRLIDADGDESIRTIEQYGKELGDGVSGSVMIFHSPASVEGTRFLTITQEGGADDQWIYLPALRRVRRIAATEGDSEFMGTDFTYSDLAGGDIEDATYRLLREESIDGEPTYVVECTPVPDSNSNYSRLIQWVSQAKWLPIRVDFYDLDGELLKVNTMTRIEQVQGRWTVINNEMKNVQTGHSTLIAVQRFVYDEQLPDSLFSTNYLRTGRP